MKFSLFPLEQSAKTTKGVAVRETLESCRRALETIVRAYLPFPCSWEGGCLTVQQKVGLFRRRLLIVVDTAESNRSLFQGGKWDDLAIEVFSADVLGATESIAQEYNKNTDREVTVLKRF